LGLGCLAWTTPCAVRNYGQREREGYASMRKKRYLGNIGALIPGPLLPLLSFSAALLTTYAEKQTNENALVERKDESSSELDNS
jgi:hypothetical protein